MEFRQTAFWKPYIECNTKLQKQVENEGNKIKEKNMQN